MDDRELIAQLKHAIYNHCNMDEDESIAFFGSEFKDDADYELVKKILEEYEE